MAKTNTIGPQGTNFVHETDMGQGWTGEETVRIITTNEPQKMNMPEDMGEAWWVDIPFADLRHLILQHIKRNSIKNIEAMDDDELEDWMEFS